MSKPKFIDNEAFRCLRSDNMEGYRRAIQGQKVVDFTDADFRGTDFRQADLGKVILKGAFLKDSDLRGCDLRHLDLEGCSLHNAKIGGTFFPKSLSAPEIMLSVQFGTRLRSS